jgi:hypothetical protein
MRTPQQRSRTVPFRISALPASQFAHLFGQPDEVLAAHGATRCVVDAFPGYPCRVTLEDAPVGETVLLMSHEYLGGDTPYRGTHAIFVREGAATAEPAAGEVPAQLRRRLLSVRAFDARSFMLDADVVEGDSLEPLLERLFADPRTAFLHVHTAKRGCYVARVDRI